MFQGVFGQFPDYGETQRAAVHQRRFDALASSGVEPAERRGVTGSRSQFTAQSVVPV